MEDISKFISGFTKKVENKPIVLPNGQTLVVAEPTVLRFIDALKALGIKSSDIHITVDSEMNYDTILSKTVEKQIFLEEKAVELFEPKNQEKLIILCHAIFVDASDVDYAKIPAWAVVAGVLRFFRLHLLGLTHAFC